jgi:hypothetical protein
VTAVDAPPGVAFAGRPAGEFAARAQGRRLAGRSLVYVLVVGAVIVYLASRNLHRPGASELVILAGVCASLAGVAFAVRRARVRVDSGGIAWGWRAASVRMGRDRIERMDTYRDGVAAVPRRGSVWFLSARDWQGIEQMPVALRRAGLPVAETKGRAPLRARLQGYGLALDILLVLDSLLVTAALAVALQL